MNETLIPLHAYEHCAEGGSPLPDALLRHVIAIAGSAPSFHNTQPWEFRTDGSVIDLYADRRRQLLPTDGDGRMLTISCGAALHHALLAIRGLGRTADVIELPTGAAPDHLARIVLQGPSGANPTPDDWAMLHAVRDRRTHRETFQARWLSQHLLADLTSVVAAEGGRLRQVSEPDERSRVSALLADTPDPHVEQADILAVFTPGDTVTDWLHAGAALSALLLTGACAGVAASHLNRPLEDPLLRRQLMRALKESGMVQLLLRVGYPAAVVDLPPTPRRPVDEILALSAG